MQQRPRQALVVRGGSDDHSPREATERFIPMLAEAGFSVSVAEDLDVYLDVDRLRDIDLIVQCWTMGTITEDQVAGLRAAVEEGGTGFAGWHGGIADSFRDSPDYLQLVGGQFAAHPGGIQEHAVEVVAGREDDPLVVGIEREWRQRTEQYWVLSDALNDVVVVTRFVPDGVVPWQQEIVMPAVWRRRWGHGRVFVSTIGHFPRDLDLPPVRTLTERGLLWAARGAQGECGHPSADSTASRSGREG